MIFFISADLLQARRRICLWFTAASDNTFFQLWNCIWNRI